MSLDINVNFGKLLMEFKIIGEAGVNHKLDAIQASINQVLEKENDMSVELDNLTVEVQEMKTIVDSAIALIQGIAEQLAAIKDDPAKIAALAAELDASANSLAAAVAANVPA